MRAAPPPSVQKRGAARRPPLLIPLAFRPRVSYLLAGLRRGNDLGLVVVVRERRAVRENPGRRALRRDQSGDRLLLLAVLLLLDDLLGPLEREVDRGDRTRAAGERRNRAGELVLEPRVGRLAEGAMDDRGHVDRVSANERGDLARSVERETDGLDDV